MKPRRARFTAAGWIAAALVAEAVLGFWLAGPSGAILVLVAMTGLGGVVLWLDWRRGAPMDRELRQASDADEHGRETRIK